MVVIVIVNWNGWYDTIRCLESIFRSEYTEFLVNFVDNNSQDNSIELISAWAAGRVSAIPNYPLNKIEMLSFPPTGREIPYVNLSTTTSDYKNLSVNSADLDSFLLKNKLLIISNGENSGFGGGNNVALKLIRKSNVCKTFWLLNNDTVVQKNTLNELVDYSNLHCRTVVGSMLHYYYNPTRIQAAGGMNLSRRTGFVKTIITLSESEIDIINGASFFASKEYIEEVGEFDENIFMYFEEADYCIRGKSKGYSFRCSKAVVFHKIGGSNFGTERSWYQVYLNKYYTLKKHYGIGSWFFIYSTSLLINSTMLNRNRAKRMAARRIILNLFSVSVQQPQFRK